MAIEFKCQCGAVCRAEEAKVGELFHCEACGLDLPVPAAGTPQGTQSPAASAFGQGPAADTPAAGSTAAGAEAAGAEAAGAEAAGPAPTISVSTAAVEEFKAQARDRHGFRDMLAQLHPDKAPADPNVPVAEVVAGPAPSMADEFRAQVGDRESFNAMMSQLHGVEPPPEAPAAAGEAPDGVTGSPAASAFGQGPAADKSAAGSTAAGSQPAGSGAGGAIAAAPMTAAGRKARGSAPPAKPAPKSRAQHHFGFKRVMWLPTLIVAGLCVLAGMYAFALYFLSSEPEQAAVVQPGVIIKEPEIVKDAQGEQWAIPRGSTAVPHEDGTMWSKDAEGRETAALQIVRDDRGRAWAVPAGKTITVSKSGNVFYQDDSGFDMAPDSADRWLDLQRRIDQRSDQIKTDLEKQLKHQKGFLWFGCGLLAVSLVLAGLGVWMRMDVIQARREMAAEAEKAGAPEAEVSALQTPHKITVSPLRQVLAVGAAGAAWAVSSLVCNALTGGPTGFSETTAKVLPFVFAFFAYGAVALAGRKSE